MKISTCTSVFNDYGNLFEIIKMMKDAGFDAYDVTIFTSSVFVLDQAYTVKGIKKWPMEKIKELEVDNPKVIDVEMAKKLRVYADEIGIVCNQTHAPYPSAFVGAKGFNEYALKNIIEAIEITAVLGAKICVVHPANDYTPEQNAELYNRLKPYAIKFGVKIALENMWNWDWEKDEALPAACSHHDNFLKHLELLDQNVFCACLDLGHSEMRGLNTCAVEMIKTLGNKIKALHIHDTDLHDDLHTWPYFSKIDFAPIWKALGEIGYDGDVTFECWSQVKKLPKELVKPSAVFQAEIGKYIREQIIKNRG